MGFAEWANFRRGDSAEAAGTETTKAENEERQQKAKKKQHVAKKWNTTHAMRHRTESMESTVGRKRYANIER